MTPKLLGAGDGGGDVDDAVFGEGEDSVARAWADGGAGGEAAEGGEDGHAGRDPEAWDAEGVAVAAEGHQGVNVAGPEVGVVVVECGECGVNMRRSGRIGVVVELDGMMRKDEWSLAADRFAEREAPTIGEEWERAVVVARNEFEVAGEAGAPGGDAEEEFFAQADGGVHEVAQDEDAACRGDGNGVREAGELLIDHGGVERLEEIS